MDDSELAAITARLEARREVYSDWARRSDFIPGMQDHDIEQLLAEVKRLRAERQ